MHYKLMGKWKNGLAYDIHTTSSKYLGKDESGINKYDTTRSEMGELVYQLKYRYDASVVERIVNLLTSNIKGWEKMDCIIAIPPSNLSREHQPVFLIATELARELNIPIYLDCLIKNSSQELKNMNNSIERYDLLKASMKIERNYDFTNKNILLVDDLYRSGKTLEVATELLNANCNPKDIYVLAMTKTRTNR